MPFFIQQDVILLPVNHALCAYIAAALPCHVIHLLLNRLHIKIGNYEFNYSYAVLMDISVP
jgi:hypothetical protein